MTPPSWRTPASSSTTPSGSMGDALIVTNGDQTDTICDFMQGDFPQRRLRTREFEPDEPQLDPPHLRPVCMPDGSFRAVHPESRRRTGRCLRQFF